MDEEGERLDRAQISGDEVDRFRNLPDDLLHKILLNLPTKDVVKCSVLSKRWGDLWPLVPGLDLECADFPDRNAFVSFVDRFLGFSKSCLQNFKLKYQMLELKCEWKWDEADIAHVTWWIDVVLKRKVQHLHLLESMLCDKEVEIPLTVYTWKSLVSLKLCKMVLLKPKSISLPCLKVIYLDKVELANDWAFEMLISGCPVLERLTIWFLNNVKVLRVCSQCLLSFKHFSLYRGFDEEQVVVIDAPRLEYLKLDDSVTDSFIINNLDSLVKADIDITFNLSSERRLNPNDLPKRNMVRDFLIGISRVKDMTISGKTLEVIYNLALCEQLPLLRNLTYLGVFIDDYNWEVLPIFLERCPNLKSLYMHFCGFPGKEERVNILPGPRRFLKSLEYVSIAIPMVKETKMMELASYFLENSTILDGFIFYLYDDRKNDDTVILMKLHAIPRLSGSCQISLCFS